MLDLPIEYLTAIGGMAAAIAYVTRAYIADLKDANAYLRDTALKTAAAHQEILSEMNRKLETMADDIDRLADERPDA